MKKRNNIDKVVEKYYKIIISGSVNSQEKWLEIYGQLFEDAHELFESDVKKGILIEVILENGNWVGANGELVNNLRNGYMCSLQDFIVQNR
jgi:hypothetical protein